MEYPTYTFKKPDNAILMDVKDHKKVDGQTILTFEINGEDIEKIYVKENYGNCECGHSTVQFGYISANNSLNVYCDYCWKKYPKSLSGPKKSKRRNTSHQYFVDQQKEVGRYFCEMCFYDKDLEVHHIVEVKDGGTDEPGNLQLLCNCCHTIVHRIRNMNARTKREALK
jgi:5-methylcytosine-specific restriction endonuclease McrA